MLKVQNLSYSNGKRLLIENVSLSFTPGILHGIVGPNGSGKTSFLKTLAGIWTPASGTVFWQESNLLTQERRLISQTITLVTAQLFLPFDFSVFEIVAMGRYPFGKSLEDKEEQERIKCALEQVEIWHLRHRPLTQLSHGERQRAFIAKALATDAPIMAFDEPTANLDIHHQIALWELLKTLAIMGKVVIVATHDLNTAQRCCNQLAIMHEGRCLAAGAPSAVLTEDLYRTVFRVDPKTQIATF